MTTRLPSDMMTEDIRTVKTRGYREDFDPEKARLKTVRSPK